MGITGSQPHIFSILTFYDDDVDVNVDNDGDGDVMMMMLMMIMYLIVESATCATQVRRYALIIIYFS